MGHCLTNKQSSKKVQEGAPSPVQERQQNAKAQPRANLLMPWDDRLFDGSEAILVSNGVVI